MKPWLVVSVKVLVLSSVLVACSRDPYSLDFLIPPSEDTGEVCSPVDESGIASMTVEQFVNSSDEALTVSNVSTASEEHIRVDHWYLEDVLWPGGVGPGGLNPNDPRTSVGSHEEVALTVELELVQGEDKVTDTLVITYEDPEGRKGQIDGSYRVGLVPTSQSCF